MIQTLIHSYRSVSRRTGRLGFLSLVAILCADCNFDLGPATDEGRLTKIGLYGPSQVQVGDTIRLSAEGSVSGLVGLLFIDRILDGRFSASDTTIATILPFIPPPTDSTSVASVLVKGRKIGAVQIKVSARGITETHRVEVVADTSTN